MGSTTLPKCLALGQCSSSGLTRKINPHQSKTEFPLLGPAGGNIQTVRLNLCPHKFPLLVCSFAGAVWDEGGWFPSPGMLL